MADTITLSAGIQAGKLSAEKFPLRNRSLHLSVEVRENELLACILDKHSNQYIAFCHFPLIARENSLMDALKDDFFASSFSGVSVAFTQNSSILVPAAFYKKERLNDYLSFPQLSSQINETPCSDYIKNLESYNLYSLNSSCISIINANFPNATLHHHSSLFIEHTLIQNKGIHDDKVYVTIFGKYIDVIVLQTGKLKLYNRFYHENSNDFLYYLLWVYEQLNLAPEKASCTFYGEADIEKLEAAGKYIKTVTTGKWNDTQGFSTALNKLTGHKYYTLFAQYLCI